MIRRGGILLETLLAIALFAGAAAFTLGAARSAFTRLDQTRREQLALDLARATLAEIEAGLLSLADLRDGERGSVGSLDDYAPSGSLDDVDLATRWAFDVVVDPTPYGDLSLVTLTVREETASGGDAGTSITLRQLLRLRDGDGS